jgi:hypothetical protein
VLCNENYTTFNNFGGKKTPIVNSNLNMMQNPSLGGKTSGGKRGRDWMWQRRKKDMEKKKKKI